MLGLLRSCLTCGHPLAESFSWEQLVRFIPLRGELYPPPDEWLCSECWQRLDWIEPGCSHCGRPMESIDPNLAVQEDGGWLCYDCQRWLSWEEKEGWGPVLAWNRGAAAYTGWTQELITQYKFKGDERLKYFFASLIIHHAARWGSGTEKIDLITCVPLASGKMRERGFNQADLIARLVAAAWNKMYRGDLLLAGKDGDEKQSKKGRKERLNKIGSRYLNNPFYSSDIIGKRIMIIDDIYTTGATLHGAALALKRGGADSIVSYTVAR